MVIKKFGSKLQVFLVLLIKNIKLFLKKYLSEKLGPSKIHQNLTKGRFLKNFNNFTI